MSLALASAVAEALETLLVNPLRPPLVVVYPNPADNSIGPKIVSFRQPCLTSNQNEQSCQGWLSGVLTICIDAAPLICAL
jgi:hypothetical protein